jgi:hypothetical protein
VDFSILCPSRGRPEDLRRLCDSINSTAEHPERIEILVYLDNDDTATKEVDYKNIPNVKFFRGPRVWMSHAQNFLYCQSKGEIIMACADDFVFRTPSWDQKILGKFFSHEDQILLLYCNDLGVHAGKIPTHFFLHRRVPEILGTWVMQGRSSQWDLWVYEILNNISRVDYLSDIVIEHLNFRQSKSSEVKFDKTTKDVTTQQFMFRPQITYKKLYRERRIDSLILADEAKTNTRFEIRYLPAQLMNEIFGRKFSRERRMRVLSMTLLELITSLASRFRRKLKSH